ncbi:jg24337 [Pararge aegeria aegeria]|uniref:Jg24337 protein n=1 Tax=Pararge aegeria aegeria TaxID=348720 RepID=A0A8S4SET4_9NEOP|nr:jg24337 [Pararge aegeria aegeria]
MHFIFIIGLVILKGSLCDWVSEWLAPLEYQNKEILTQDSKNRNLKFIPDDDSFETVPSNRYLQSNNVYAKNKISSPSSKNEEFRGLKLKLDETLKTAETLTAILKKQIKEIETREGMLKEAIANGRSGVTTLTVSTLGQAPRTYIIRDGFWTLCNGMVQYPDLETPYSIFNELFSTPRCIGQEITSKRDPCVFNSIIKYETIPVTRRSTYFEDDYLCLKTTFNNTLEKFMSVTKKVVDDTCKNGVVRSLTDNVLDCGVRVVSEYSYYPHKDYTTAILPLEYCTEKDGSCKLIVAWHLSNKTIENFEFLKSDENFKKFFIKPDSFIEPFI